MCHTQRRGLSGARRQNVRFSVKCGSLELSGPCSVDIGHRRGAVLRRGLRRHCRVQCGVRVRNAQRTRGDSKRGARKGAPRVGQYPAPPHSKRPRNTASNAPARRRQSRSGCRALCGKTTQSFSRGSHHPSRRPRAASKANGPCVIEAQRRPGRQTPAPGRVSR